MAEPARTGRTPWRWVPSLYFAEGLPYVVVMSVSVALYKLLDVPNDAIAFYTSLLYLPWVVKPLWSPLVDLVRTKRAWILATQLLIGAALGGVALTLHLPGFFTASLAIFWVMAFASATHDVAADGFYMLGLSERRQSQLVGIRSLAYRLAMITGSGGVLIVADGLVKTCGLAVSLAWSLTFAGLAGLFVVLFAWHRFSLPRPAADAPRAAAAGALFRESLRTFAVFFRRPGIGTILAFLLLYRFGEGQLVKLVQPFLLDSRDAGGLGLSAREVGMAYGTVGVIALIAGGILGGFAVASRGLRAWLPWMVAAINVPNLAYVYLAYARPESLVIVTTCVAAEQFGYGFGFTAYLLYMIHVSQGPHRTVHYALCTGIMALGMMLPGMVSGWIQDRLGYPLFFVWVVAATIPAFVVAARVRIDPAFGLREDATRPHG